MKKKLAVKVKQERIDQNRAADEGAGQAAQPATSEGIFVAVNPSKRFDFYLEKFVLSVHWAVMINSI